MKGAVEPTVAKNVKPLSILDICFSTPASSIPLILSLKFILDFDFSKPCIDSLKREVIGSLVSSGKLL